MKKLLLKGSFDIKKINELEKFLDNSQNYFIDYSEANLDHYCKIIINSFNEKILIQPEIKKTKFSTFIVEFLKEKANYIKDIFKFSKLIFLSSKTKQGREIFFQDTLEYVYSMGILSIPICLAISFFLGAIVAVQSAAQLKMFGCEIYALNLLIVSFFKEGSLLVSLIILTGRSGAALISQVGSMKLSNEWDSLKIMKIDPQIYLLKPRIYALIFIMPMLAYISCISGIFGGYIILKIMININDLFAFNLLRETLKFSTFFAILLKGPIYGFLLGLVCSFEANNVSINSVSITKGIARGVIYSFFICMFFDMIIDFLVVGF